MTSSQELSPQQVSVLIDQLLKAKDPATVGLRRILKKKADDSGKFPLKEMAFEQFTTAQSTQTDKKESTIFDANEVMVLELQKKLNDCLAQIEQEKKNAAHLAEASYRKGIAEGESRGRKEEKEAARKDYATRLEQVEQRIAAILNDVSKARRELLQGAQRSVLELSMIIARKIIDTEIKTNPDIVLHTIKRALTYIPERERLTVRVAANDLETVTRKKEFWLSITERLDGIKIEADPHIERGGCIIESGSGVADARTGVLLDELHDVIASTWASQQSGGDVSETSPIMDDKDTHA